MENGADIHNEEFVRMLLGIQEALRGYVYAHVNDRSLTNDVVQEVSIVLWRKYDQFRAGGSFLRWALGIARNEIRHANRQSMRSRLVFDDEMAERLADCYSEMEPELEERRRILDVCVGRLPETSRKLVEMRYGRGLPLQEVAEAVHKKVNAVTVAISRIRAALIACVDRHSTGYGGMVGGEG